MLETGTSGLMSGEEKRAAASRPRTALFLDSTRHSIGAELSLTGKTCVRENVSERQGGGVYAWRRDPQRMPILRQRKRSEISKQESFGLHFRRAAPGRLSFRRPS